MSTTPALDAVDLYWLPLGAGAQAARHSGRVYEALVARRERRRPLDLYHAALEVRVGGQRYVIESAPEWDRHEPDRGVVAVGPVGLPWLGRWRWFRYEVRCWPDGLIPDIAAAVDSPRRLATSPEGVRGILHAAPEFPALTWGRDEQRTGDMWNSNSLIAWLLAVSRHDVEAVAPPPGGRAPGWEAGLVAARRRGARTETGRAGRQVPV